VWPMFCIELVVEAAVGEHADAEGRPLLHAFENEVR
jgi:hypothetical protein